MKKAEKNTKKEKITVKDLDLNRVKGGSTKDPKGGYKLTLRKR